MGLLSKLGERLESLRSPVRILHQTDHTIVTSKGAVLRFVINDGGTVRRGKLGGLGVLEDPMEALRQAATRSSHLRRHFEREGLVGPRVRV